MELALALVALLVAVVAVGLMVGLRTQVERIPRVDTTQLSADVAGLQQQLADVRHDLEHSQRELDELKAVTLAPPAPALPRARGRAGLTDLREQLRAAHREPEPSTDE